jgi:hypothetical protein
MRQKIRTGLTLCAAAVALSFTASADTWNKKTVVTTNGQLEIPGGVVLEPGKYVLKLADSQSNRHIVQVFNEDENHIFATILAIPNYRQQVTGDTVITTWETPSGRPPAIRAWFYPGDNFGQEFAYPKQRAMEISRTSGETVPQLSSEVSEVNTEETERTEVAESRETPIMEDHAESPSSYAEDEAQKADEPELMAQARPQEPPAEPQPATPAQEPAPQPESRDELPQTASPAALMGMLGAVSLGAAAALRAVNRRRRYR